MPAHQLSPRLAASMFKACAIIGLSCLLFAPVSSGTTVKILFSPKPSQGAHLWGGLTFDRAGNLYGTAQEGGIKCTAFYKGCGTVFELTPQPSGAWTHQLIHQFVGGTDGYLIYAGVIFDSDGNLYGTAGAGGAENYGIAYELSPGPNGWTETVLHSFPSAAGDGEYPGPLVFDQSGNLYGTSYEGETPCGEGMVFELSPNGGSGWIENQLGCFPGTGSNPAYLSAPVTFDSSGNIYSTSYLGGLNGTGTVFELSPSGGGWSQTVLYNFPRNEQVNPWPPLVFDKNGNMYGVTYGGIFELSPSKGGWNYSTIYTDPGGSGGVSPYSLMIGADGNLYGTGSGGSSTNCKGGGCGTVFKVTQQNGEWQFTVLYSFPGGAGGEYPEGGLIMDQHGNLYGTTYYGGRRGCGGGCGVVFELTP